MKCKQQCSEKAICSAYCKKHFCDYFERKVKNTIRKHQLLNKKDKILVGVSGGKDSLTVLHLLHQTGYCVEALAVDEGIAGYRDQTLEDAKRFCNQYSIPLKVVSYKKEYGKTLDETMQERKKNACSPCGTFRRNLLHTYSKGYDKLVTGHNMDDEAQTVLINLFRNHTALIPRQGPITTQKKGFVQRVKPLYFMKEKEVMTYSYLKGIKTTFIECPYSKMAYRIYLRDVLNQYEDLYPDAKENILKQHLLLKKKVRLEKKEMNYCEQCGEPSAKKTCQSCYYAQQR